jgi:carboxypeptidase Q
LATRRSVPLLVCLAVTACASRPSPARAPAVDARLATGASTLIEASLQSDSAYRLLGELSDRHGHRLSGSERLERAIDWSVEQMRALGLQNVRKEAVMVPVWIRGEESLELTSPMQYDIAMLGLGGSIGTPAEGIEAQVVVVESFDDLDARPDEAITGRIVLFDVPYQGYGRTVPYRSRGAIAAARKGAVALLVRSIGPNGMRLPHTGTMVYDESVPRIPAAAVSSEDAMMMRRMQDRGDRIVARLKMQARTEPDRLSHNVVGELVGRELPEEVVVIGGHIDSWDVGQGAQDDGVGCMISLAAAELMLRSGLVPRRTIRVVFWTNEENGLRGGEAYRDRHADSLGSPRRGDRERQRERSGNGFSLRPSCSGARPHGRCKRRCAGIGAHSRPGTPAPHRRIAREHGSRLGLRGGRRSRHRANSRTGSPMSGSPPRHLRVLHDPSHGRRHLRPHRSAYPPEERRGHGSDGLGLGRNARLSAALRRGQLRRGRRRPSGPVPFTPACPNRYTR